MLAVTATGALEFIGGTAEAQEGYALAEKIGTSGRNSFTQITGVGDFNGDGKADLLASRTDGTLWFYAGTGNVMTSTGYAAGHRIGGGGWNAYTKLIGAGDFNGDGRSDLLVVRADGELWLYAGTGAGAASDDGYRAGTRFGTGWAAYTALVAGGR